MPKAELRSLWLAMMRYAKNNVEEIGEEIIWGTLGTIKLFGISDGQSLNYLIHTLIFNSFSKLFARLP